MDEKKRQQLELLEAEIRAAKSLLGKLEEAAKDVREQCQMDEIEHLDEYLEQEDQENTWSVIRDEINHELHGLLDKLKSALSKK